MRITQRNMYNSFIDGMQSTLGAYMESNIQGGSQKKINRPSDDPAGMALVLNTRNSIDNIKQFERNADTAEGWLKLADSTLSQHVTLTLESIKTLAGQAADGGKTAENRKQIALQLRELFGQLLNLSNTDFEGKSLFAGHKYDSNAYEEGLSVSTTDPKLAGMTFPTTGKSEYTQMVEFTTGGTMGGTAPINYRWSPDGGSTWKEGTFTPPDNKLDLDGIEVFIPMKDKAGNDTVITAKNATEDSGTNNGTVLLVRPTAIYMGDDQDMPPTSKIMGGPPGLTSSVKGNFGSDTFVRFDTQANLNAAGSSFEYSYSTDNGASWVKATATVPDPANGTVRLPVPGGYMEMDTTTTTPPTGVIAPGTQAIIHPNRAELGYEIMNNTYISVNSVGKNIFGGMYDGEPVGGLKGNMFETVGELIAACEVNSQQGAQESLEKLTASLETVMTEATRIGGLENRVSLAQDVLSFQKLDRQERLSYTEDVNLSELLTRLAQQQMAYNTVLKSSSMIMQLNLSKFV